MNKQELIKHIEDLPYKEGPIVDKIDISRKGLLELVNQLDEPQKPVVPQFVVDWIKYCKNTNVTMTRALLVGEVDFYNYANQKDFSRLKEFLETESNQETFVLAWIYGYEVEKEPKYTVKIKATKHYFAKDGNGRIYFSLKYESAFTKIELEKANLGWVFDCPGIEVLEVED